MAKFITSTPYMKQLSKPGKFKLCNNELLLDDNGSILLCWRGFITDNYTWIKNARWDIRCSHFHDVGCSYHQVVKVKLTEQELWDMNFLVKVNNEVYCKDIPLYYLQIHNISKKWINDLFYRAMKAADNPTIPAIIRVLYRCGVAFNFMWYFKWTPISWKDIYSFSF